MNDCACRLCDAIREAGNDPAVARLVDRLTDELTVVLLARDTPVNCASPPEEMTVRSGYSGSGAGFRRALVALGFGPLLLRELVLEVYPHPTDDADEAALRVQRVQMLLRRLIEKGEVERVAHGTYALAHQGSRHAHQSTIGDCRRILADPRVQPAGGLTAREIADRLDMPVGTIRTWLFRLRYRGTPIVTTPVAFAGVGSGGFRYRLGEEVA